MVLGVGAWAWMASRCGSRAAASGVPTATGRARPVVPAQPWRNLVSQALDAQTRFDHTVDDWPPGPIREHLSDLRPRLTSSCLRSGLSPGVESPCPGWSTGSHRPDNPLSNALARTAPDRGGAPPGRPHLPGARSGAGPQRRGDRPQLRAARMSGGARAGCWTGYASSSPTSTRRSPPYCSWASTSRPPIPPMPWCAHSTAYTTRSPPLPPAWPSATLVGARRGTPTAKLQPAVAPDRGRRPRGRRPKGRRPGGRRPKGRRPGAAVVRGLTAPRFPKALLSAPLAMGLISGARRAGRSMSAWA